jgi:meso-butanediol dehydrogenase/(S,S)-butanediol dehydrogenase/diacetyl reductase
MIADCGFGNAIRNQQSAIRNDHGEFLVEQRLLGRVAVVTGAGQGIGRGIALRLAREGAGIAVAEYNPDSAAGAAAEIRSLGGQALACAVDIADVAAVGRMVDEVVAHLGHIDILVNNAGRVQTKPMLDLTETDWDSVIDVNQRGTFFLIQAVARQMIRQIPEALRIAAQTPADIFSVQKGGGAEEQRAGGAGEQGSTDVQTFKRSSVQTSAEGKEERASYGKIVSLSSVAGRRGRPLQTHYAASKAAIISLTQSAALALAPYRINVNAVCPGIVPTPMWQQIDRDRGELFGAKPGEAMASFIQTVPLKRAATPEDIAGAVAFFCSPDSDYITGQSLNVDGGFEMD